MLLLPVRVRLVLLMKQPCIDSGSCLRWARVLPLLYTLLLL